MRISTAYQYSMYNQGMADALEQLSRAGKVVSSGVKLDAMSEDPCAGSLVLGLQSALAQSTQYATNTASVEGRLKADDNSMGELSDIINQVKTLVQQGANGTADQSARDAMISQINTIEQRLVAIGNTEYTTGQYLFSGQAVTTKPFSVTNTGLTYSGDHGAINVEIQKGQVLQGNVVGAPLLTDIYNALETAKTDLASGDVHKLGNEDLDLLATVGQNVLAQRADVGARLQEVGNAKTQLADQQDTLKKLISDHRDADMTQAISDYQAAQNAYQAALSVAAKGTKLSLMDFLSIG